MQTLKTTRFGEITINPDQVLTFVEPILGFEHLTRYAILNHLEASPFKWLQSLDDPDLAFVVTQPALFGIPYEFELPDEAAQKLGINNPDELTVVTIVNIPQGNPAEMTTNLLGPLLIHESQRKALQLVLIDTEFSTQQRLLSEETLKQTASPSVSTADHGA